MLSHKQLPEDVTASKEKSWPRSSTSRSGHGWRLSSGVGHENSSGAGHKNSSGTGGKNSSKVGGEKGNEDYGWARQQSSRRAAAGTMVVWVRQHRLVGRWQRPFVSTSPASLTSVRLILNESNQLLSLAQLIRKYILKMDIKALRPQELAGILANKETRDVNFAVYYSARWPL